MDTVLDDPLVGKWSLTANEEWRGLRSLDVLEKIVVMAGARGLLVMLDMHRLSAAVWPTTHGLWYSKDLPAQRLHDAWHRIARLFCSHWNGECYTVCRIIHTRLLHIVAGTHS